MTNGYAAYVLLSILLSPSAIANAVDSCLRDYEERYNADSEAGEALPPMRNLYPDWEEDCKNGGRLNAEIKTALKQERSEETSADNVLPTDGFQAKWELVPKSFAGMPPVDWVEILSTTDYKVHIQKITINKNRCNGIVFPGYLLNPSTTVDYGQSFRVGAPGCGRILELTIETDIGSVTINPYG